MFNVAANLVIHFRKHPVLRRLCWIFPVIIFSVPLFLFIIPRQSAETAISGWNRTIQITGKGLQIKNISTVNRGNLIIAVFEGTAGKESGIYSAISFNKGDSFIKPIKLVSFINNDTAQINDHFPKIALSGSGKCTIVWQDIDPQSGYSRIYAINSDDLGVNWSVPVLLDAPADIAFLPQIIYDQKNTLHLFYHAYADNGFNLFSAESSNGIAFSTPKSLIKMEGNIRGAFMPAIHLNGANVYLVWQVKTTQQGGLRDDLFFKKSADYGNSWTPAVRLVSSDANEVAPVVVSRQNNVYVIYQSDVNRNWSVKMLSSIDGGVTWGSPVDVSLSQNSSYAPTAVISDNNELFICWSSLIGNNSLLFTRKYDLQEKKFSDIAQLSSGGRNIGKTQLLSLGRPIAAFWDEGGILYAKFSDIYTAPPLVKSVTHPEQKWSRETTAVIEWTAPADDSGISGYATFKNDNPDFNPTVPNLDARLTKMKIPDLADGVSYFHIRAIDGAGNYSRTIHYPLKVSKNPLQIPDIFSSTNPPGQESENHSPMLQWKIDDTLRLKGFEYSLSRDKTSAPANYTEGTDIKFDNLPEGRYFFSVRAVDKNNYPGRTGIYELIIGKAGAQITTDYTQLVEEHGATIKPKTTRHAKKPASLPVATLELPLSDNGICNSNQIKGKIIVKNILPEEVKGFSLSVGPSPITAGEEVNWWGDSFTIGSLVTGNYFASIRMKYIRKGDRKGNVYWSEPVTTEFKVEYMPPAPSRFVFKNLLFDRIYKNWLALAVSIPLLLILVMSVAVGTRFNFWWHKRMYRLRMLFQLVTGR